MLDPEAPDERRDSIVQTARGRIESNGSLTAERAWGLRKLAYEINQRTEADYRFFRFQAPSEVLGELDHSLKITDGVMRFRIFKVDPRSPVIDPPPPVALASSSSGRPPGGRRPGRPRARRLGPARRRRAGTGASPPPARTSASTRRGSGRDRGSRPRTGRAPAPPACRLRRPDAPPAAPAAERLPPPAAPAEGAGGETPAPPAE